MATGDITTACDVLLAGFAYRCKILADGRRQIVSIHVPGDFLDLVGLHLGTSDHTINTIGPTTIATIPHADLLQLAGTHAKLAHLLWRDTLIDAAIYREWVVNLGARQGLARVAHSLCEIV